MPERADEDQPRRAAPYGVQAIAVDLSFWVVPLLVGGAYLVGTLVG